MSEATVKPKYLRGALFALGGPIAGIIIWLIVWEMGFIASLASFAMAWLTVRLYRLGAGSVDKKSLVIILSYIAIGLIGSLFAVMVDDAVHYLFDHYSDMHEVGVWALLTNHNFWVYMGDNIFHNSELMKGYTSTIFMSLALGGLGAYSTVKNVILDGKSEPTA